MTKIYISSTFSDLQEYRRAAYDMLRKLGHDAIAMEDYVAADQRPLAKCLSDVARCDVYLGIFAWRYGYIPGTDNPERRSITELEYRKAAELGKACLIFLLEEDVLWPRQAQDAITSAGERGERINNLRKELGTERLVSFFKSPDHLAGLVSAAIQRWEAEQPPELPEPAPPVLRLPIQPMHQLRAPVADFTGRAAEVERLVEALQRAAASGTAAAICGVRGMGGIGKTELAYNVAQRLAATFPDAQLLIELRGASDTPLSAAQALQKVIRAFEPEAKLPDDLIALQELYREYLTGKRVLILADDARDKAQVDGLLPPTGSALLVTSRNRFTLPGMVTLNLGQLALAEAEQLARTICPRLGRAAGELARLCGYLPLALRLSASLLANDDTRAVSRYLAQLKKARLAQLYDPDDLRVSVAASIQLSYDALTPEGQQALAQLSVFRASFDRAAATAVVADIEDIEGVLGLLRRRSLLEWDEQTERYSLHDLVREFAAARLPSEDQASVTIRHARHYLAVANHAQFDLYLKGDALAGLALFDQERAQIDAGWSWAQAHAGDPQADELILGYANAVSEIGDLRYHLRRERIPQLEAHLATARRLGRRAHEGYALMNLGNAYNDLGEVQKAVDYHEQALEINRQVGDRQMEGRTLNNLGIAYKDFGDVDKAIRYHEQALEIHRQVGDRQMEAGTLNNLGNAHKDLGEVQKAIEYYEQSLTIRREVGDRQGEGQTLNNLGIAYKDLGEVQKAIDYYQQSLTIKREVGDRQGEGRTLNNLGIAYQDLGEVQKAIDYYQQSLTIKREVGDRRGEGQTLNNLGFAYKDFGEVEKALDYYEQSLSIKREVGDRPGEANTSWNLALAYEQQGDLTRAVALMQTCVDYEREVGHPNAEKDAARLAELQQRLAEGAAPEAT